MYKIGDIYLWKHIIPVEYFIIKELFDTGFTAYWNHFPRAPYIEILNGMSDKFYLFRPF